MRTSDHSLTLAVGGRFLFRRLLLLQSLFWRRLMHPQQHLHSTGLPNVATTSHSSSTETVRHSPHEGSRSGVAAHMACDGLDDGGLAPVHDLVDHL